MHEKDKEESVMSQLFGMDNVISSLQGNYNNVKNEAAKSATTKNTVGNPKLSEKASSYYEELKAKHSDVEFVLVSNDKKDVAKEYTSNLASDKSMIVLISEDEVEQMAIDENLRNKNEKLIEDAKLQMPSLLEELKKSGAEVKSFGMEFNDDGTASYFAFTGKEDLVTVSASSMDELIKKIQDIAYTAKADSVMTEREKMVGQSFDFSIFLRKIYNVAEKKFCCLPSVEFCGFLLARGRKG